MKNIGVFYLKILGFLEVKFSIYLNRRVFVMITEMGTLSREISFIFSSLLQRGMPERKEFSPFGSKFFPFTIDPFQTGPYVQEKQTGNHNQPCQSSPINKQM